MYLQSRRINCSMTLAKGVFIFALVFVFESIAAEGDFRLKDSAKTSANTPKQSTAGKPVNTRDVYARALTLSGLDGEKHSLKDWKGKVVILNFWATWCSPCLYEIRDFVAYQEQYKSRGLQIIGVGLDEEKKLRNVQRSLEINYPVLISDPENNAALMKTWGNGSGIVPYTVVIDRAGRMIFTYHGQINQEMFDENILPLLDKG